MSSGIIIALMLEKENAISHWRDAIGPTDPSVAKNSSPGSLRAEFGKNKQQNGFHGSDSIESAERELKLFFTINEIKT